MYFLIGRAESDDSRTPVSSELPFFFHIYLTPQDIIRKGVFSGFSIERIEEHHFRGRI